MASIITAAGYYRASELADTSSHERLELYKLLSSGKPGYARLLRNMLESQGAATESETKRAPPYKEADIYAALKNRARALAGIGELLTPRQEAAGLFAGALYEGKEAQPPYLPPPTPTLSGCPRALQ